MDIRVVFMDRNKISNLTKKLGYGYNRKKRNGYGSEQHCQSQPRQHCYPETKCHRTPNTQCIPVTIFLIFFIPLPFDRLTDND